MRRSDEQYERDMIQFKRIRMKPEVKYGRLRDDKYGKGLNTITKEQLEREGVHGKWVVFLINHLSTRPTNNCPLPLEGATLGSLADKGLLAMSVSSDCVDPVKTTTDGVNRATGWSNAEQEPQLSRAR